MERLKAILLLGPTGAGKSPLGEYLEDVGIRGKRCAHFDFGQNLRDIAAGGAARLDGSERSFLRTVLDSETRPLLDYYRSEGVSVLEVVVGLRTSPEEIVRMVPGYLAM